MATIQEAQAKGFGSHGGLKTVIQDRDIQPLGKRVRSIQNAFW